MNKRKKMIKNLTKYIKLHKRPILRELQIVTYIALLVIVILQFVHMNDLQKEYDNLAMDYSEISTQIEQIVSDYDTLKQENVNINKLNEKIQKEVDSLNQFINEINKEETVKSNKLTSRGGGDEYLKTKTMNVTAYTAGAESTGKSPSHPTYGITASGTKVKEGRTVACSKAIPFGTKIYIPYFDNTYTCEDRGGAIKKGHLDVYMKSLSAAREFGRKDLQVHIIEWGE